jgi:hypothetical protein
VKTKKTHKPPTQTIRALCCITPKHETIVQRAALNDSSAIHAIADLVHERISTLPENSDYKVVHTETIGLVEHVFRGQYGDDYADAMHKMGANHARKGLINQKNGLSRHPSGDLGITGLQPKNRFQNRQSVF